MSRNETSGRYYGVAFYGKKSWRRTRNRKISSMAVTETKKPISERSENRDEITKYLNERNLQRQLLMRKNFTKARKLENGAQILRLLGTRKK